MFLSNPQLSERKALLGKTLVGNVVLQEEERGIPSSARCCFLWGTGHIHSQAIKKIVYVNFPDLRVGTLSKACPLNKSPRNIIAPKEVIRMTLFHLPK